MQLHVDTDTESVAGLMLLSRLLIDYANMKAQHDKALEESYKDHEHVHAQPVLTVGPITTGALEAGMKVMDGQGRDLGTLVGPEPDPAVIFGKFPVPTGATPMPPVSNVVPLFPQPALNLPGATGPAALNANTAGTVPATTTPATSSTPLPGVQPVAAAPGVVSAEVDSQGIPWDERIHSSSKKRKGDGTWNLKRGVDHVLAQTITAQLIAAKLPPSVSSTPTVAGLGNPAPLTGTAGVLPVSATSVPNVAGTVMPQANPTVPLPPGLQTSAVPVLPFTDSTPSSAPVFVPVAQPSAGVPIPPTPAAGAVPVPEVNPVKRFGAMMTKVSQALGAKAITQQQVLDAHVAVGLQQLQQAVLNPDKIPLIEAALGLA